MIRKATTRDYYTSKERQGPGLFLLETEHGRQLWAEVKLRKPCPCVLCGNRLSKGVAGYRPLVNVDNRGARICVQCMTTDGGKF